jgi:uncharacterized phage protein gp47/JayE
LDGASLPGVTRVFVKGNGYGRGTVGVWFLMDDNYPQGIPLQADVDAVQAHIDSVAPVTANVIVHRADCRLHRHRRAGNLTPDTQACAKACGRTAIALQAHGAAELAGRAVHALPSGIWQAVGNAPANNITQIVLR